MKFIIASLFVIAAVHALPINNLQVELTPVEIAATYTADANAALKSCQGWFDAVCSDALKKITNNIAIQKITDCNSVDLEASALAQKRLSTCAKRWLVSSCKEDVEGLVQDMIALGLARVKAKTEADKAVAAVAKKLAEEQAAAKVQAEQFAAVQAAAKKIAEEKKAIAEATLQVEAAKLAKATDAAARAAAQAAVAAAEQAIKDLNDANKALTTFAGALNNVTMPFVKGTDGCTCGVGCACWATNANKLNMPKVCTAWDSSIGKAYEMAGVKKLQETCATLKKGVASNEYDKIADGLNSAVDDIKKRIAPKIAAFNAALASATATAAQARLAL